VESTTHGKVIRANGVTLAVRGLDYGPRGGGDRALAGSFTTAKGSRHVLTVVGTSNEPIHLPDAAKTDIGIDRTIANWQAWSKEFSYDGPWADAVQRSALALKLLIYAPTGSIAAAATTSLPESVSGGKTWDYRFGWVRDVSYTLGALIRFGLREETHAAVAWLLTTIREQGLHIFYTLDGSDPADVEERAVPGWRGSGPVIVGNPARDQLQLGVYGDLFDMMRRYVEAGNLLDAETGRTLAGVADQASDSWRMPDSGMWELEELQQYTASRMGCWSALDSAVRLCELGQIPGDGKRWAAERDAIAAWIGENCWSEERQSYVSYPDSDELDATVLLHAPSGFDRGERMSSTIDAIRTELGRGPLLYRFSGAEAEEGAFVACSFWMASALACVGRTDEAVSLMDEMVDLGNDVGLYSEMIEPDSGDFLGNLPQALSHLALVNTAITIEQLTRKSSPRTH
jgi:GH15 family glucan-1,4-alpha-glucosidase